MKLKKRTNKENNGNDKFTHKTYTANMVSITLKKTRN